MIPKPTLIKLGGICGSYILAGCFALAAIPQFEVQDRETLSGAMQSIQEAFNTSKGDATIVIPSKKKRHPWSGFFALSSVFWAVAGTGGLTWVLFSKSSKKEKTAKFSPRGILPPSTEAKETVTPEETRPNFATPRPVANPHGSTQLPSFNDRRQQLFDKLAQSPQAWVLQLLEATPILIWGEPRSGKTELAQFIALLRRLFVEHALEANDPQGHLNHWAACFPIYGSRFNYLAIDQRLKAYQDRLGQTPQQAIATIWEDYLQYPDLCPSQSLDPYNFIKSIATEAPKKEEYAILVDRNKLPAAPVEIETLIERSFIQVRLFAQRSATGRVVPSGRGFLRGLTQDRDGVSEEIEIAIPPWMQVRFLLDTFPELERLPQSEPATAPAKSDRAGSPIDSPVDSPIDVSPPRDSKPLSQASQTESNLSPATTTSKPLSQRLQTIKQFIQFKQQGLSKEDTIYQMWRIAKNDSQQWEDASTMHDRMLEEYRDFIEYRRSLDRLGDVP
ncbi:MAG: hypothetical protein SW833_00845 [Cyanobacteriota bacterium]|nr:hypothetical protein [Cyanobacteriota bacterium]